MNLIWNSRITQSPLVELPVPDTTDLKKSALDEFSQKIQRQASQLATPEEFRQKALELLVTRFSAHLGIIWVADESALDPAYQFSIGHSDPPKIELSEPEHLRILNQVSDSGIPALLNNVCETANLSVVHFDCPATNETGLLELLLPKSTGSLDTENQNVAIHAQICGLAERKHFKPTGAYHDFVGIPQQVHHGEEQSDIADPSFLEFVHSSIDLRETSENIASELRRVLNVDRVGVLRFRGSKPFLSAISGQVKVNRRSEVVRLMESLAKATLATRNLFLYPTNNPIPSQIQKPLTAYLNMSEVRSLVVIPIFEEKSVADSDDNPAAQSKKQSVIGGIVVEHFGGLLDQKKFSSQLGLYRENASIAYRNAHNHRKLLLYPIWKILGDTKIAAFSRKFSKLRLGLLAAAILIAIAFMIPADFNIIAEGVMLPVQRQRIYADLEGVVSEIKIDHGSVVEKGETIAILENQDLLLQLERITGEIAGLRQRLDSTQARRITNRTDQQLNNFDQDNAKDVLVQLEGLRKLKAKLTQTIDRLVIKSPLNGQITTWDVRDALLNRPVQPGEVLLEVANTESDWEMLINVPAKKIGHVIRAQGRLGSLKVVYVVASEPGIWLEGEVIEIERSTRLQADNSQTITVRVRVAQTDHPYPANTGTSAKIYCGRRSLAYVWIHDAVEFVRENVIFRVF